jgi:hypothetical protein
MVLLAACAGTLVDRVAVAGVVSHQSAHHLRPHQVVPVALVAQTTFQALAELLDRPPLEQAEQDHKAAVAAVVVAHPLHLPETAALVAQVQKLQLLPVGLLAQVAAAAAAAVMRVLPEARRKRRMVQAAVFTAAAAAGLEVA